MKSDKTTDEKVTKKDSAVPLVSQAKKEPTEHSHGLFSIVVISLLFGFLGGFLATSLISKNAIENTQTPSTQILSAESEAVTKVAREVSPSVVSITVRTSVSNPFFFRDFEQEGAGTGIILTEDGLICPSNMGWICMGSSWKLPGWAWAGPMTAAIGLELTVASHWSRVCRPVPRLRD